VKIFVQFASYRDPQLVPTIEDMLEKAYYKDIFNFGICWQYGEDEDTTKYDGKSNFRIKKHHFDESGGLGWARNITNQLYNGEELTLQLDSHHRFEKDWDKAMLEDYEQAKGMAEKPIISTYCTPWEPDKNIFNPTPCLMSQYEFSNDKLLMSRPYYIGDYKSRNKVIKARTLSGHFFLVDGKFISEVPYDPEIYFGGYTEETTMSVRAFTNGYDFFSPYRQLIWHEYTRNYRKKHWEDHGTQSKTKKTSGERDVYARNKTRQMFGQEQHNIDMKSYGLGSVRSLHDYEVYGGFDFKNCLIQEYTLKVQEPPNPSDWEQQFITNEYKMQALWDNTKVNKKDKKLQFVAIGFLNKSGIELKRVDLNQQNDPEVIVSAKNNYITELKTKDKPEKWVLHPYYEGEGWGERQEGSIKFL